GGPPPVTAPRPKCQPAGYRGPKKKAMEPTRAPTPNVHAPNLPPACLCQSDGASRPSTTFSRLKPCSRRAYPPTPTRRCQARARYWEDGHRAADHESDNGAADNVHGDCNCWPM